MVKTYKFVYKIINYNYKNNKYDLVCKEKYIIKDYNNNNIKNILIKLLMDIEGFNEMDRMEMENMINKEFFYNIMENKIKNKFVCGDGFGIIMIKEIK